MSDEITGWLDVEAASQRISNLAARLAEAAEQTDGAAAREQIISLAIQIGALCRFIGSGAEYGGRPEPWR